MRKLVSQARKTTETLREPVQVLPLLRSFYPERKITNQMRRILSVALDKAGIDRAKRQDSAMPRSLTSRRAILKPPPVETPVPAVLGGMTSDVTDVIEVSLPLDVQERIDAMNARRCSLNFRLATMADEGNYDAYDLLMERLGDR
jgi:hypothetical protein